MALYPWLPYPSSTTEAILPMVCTDEIRASTVARTPWEGGLADGVRLAV
jgi:hypothetical protein